MFKKVTKEFKNRLQLAKEKSKELVTNETGAGIIDYLGIIALGLALIIVVGVVLMAFAPATTTEILNAGVAKLRQMLQF